MTRHRRLLFLLIPFALFGTRCNNAECESLRDELTALKDTWTRCDNDLDCIKFFGNPADCTGILTCDFSGNRAYRLEAERRIASLPEETTDCTGCSSPNCVSGAISWCEPVSKRCMIVTGFIDGGADQGTAGTGGSAGSGSGGTGG
jgi:hypothetical protein